MAPADDRHGSAGADQLEAAFRARGVVRGGELLLGADDALDLIRQAEAAGLPVLGVDGMIVTPDATTSPVEHVADFSAGAARGDGNWNAAMAFVAAHRALGLAFALTLADDRRP